MTGYNLPGCLFVAAPPHTCCGAATSSFPARVGLRAAPPASRVERSPPSKLLILHIIVDQDDFFPEVLPQVPYGPPPALIRSICCCRSKCYTEASATSCTRIRTPHAYPTIDTGSAVDGCLAMKRARELRQRAELCRKVASVATSGDATIDRALLNLAERLEGMAEARERGIGTNRSSLHAQG